VLRTLGLGLLLLDLGVAMAFVAIIIFTILFGGGLGDRF
jgi:hypothetical protein